MNNKVHSSRYEENPARFTIEIPASTTSTTIEFITSIHNHDDPKWNSIFGTLNFTPAIPRHNENKLIEEITFTPQRDETGNYTEFFIYESDPIMPLPFGDGLDFFNVIDDSNRIPLSEYHRNLLHLRLGYKCDVILGDNCIIIRPFSGNIEDFFDEREKQMNEIIEQEDQHMDTAYLKTRFPDKTEFVCILDSLGRIVLPYELTERLHIAKYDTVSVGYSGEDIVIKKFVPPAKP